MRNALLVVVALLAIGLALWGFGVLGPSPGAPEEVGGAGDGAPDAATAPEGTTAPATAKGPGDAGLASGAPRVVARTKPPTLDGPRITGRVTDRAGKGVPQARVIASPETGVKAFTDADLGTPGCAATDAVTDEEGRFAVAADPAAPFHALIVVAAGYGPSITRNVATYAVVTIVLDRGAVLVGTVTDADGAPLVGAKVRVLLLLDAYRVEMEAVATAGGAYRLEGLPALRMTPANRMAWTPSALEVSAEGYAPVFQSFSVGDLEPGQERRRDFILVRGARVAGRVLDADGDRPIAGAKVVVWSVEGQSAGGIERGGTWMEAPWAHRRLGETTSDAEGRYAFEHLPCQGYHPTNPGMYGRRGPVMGYAAAVVPGYVPRSEEVPFGRDGATHEIDLRVSAGVLIEGRVVDGAGKPVPKATVVVDLKGKAQIGWLPATLFRDVPTAWNWEGVGEDGRYRLLAPVERGRAVDVKVIGRYPQGPSSAWSEEGDGSVTVPVSGTGPFDAPDLVLGSRATDASGIAAVVRTEEGKPVFGATVMIEQWWIQARTDAEGRVSLQLPVVDPKAGKRADLPPNARLVVRAPTFAPTQVPLPPNAVGGPPVEVILKPGRRLTGRVVRADGAPATKGSVSVADGNRPVGEAFPAPGQQRVARPPGMGSTQAVYAGTSIDKDGTFVVEDLPDGPYHVAAWPASAAGMPPATAGSLMGLVSNVPSGATDVEVRLPPAASFAVGGLEGRVVDVTTKRPVAGVQARLVKPGGDAPPTSGMPFPGPIQPAGRGPFATITSPGVFEMTDVVEGTWTLVVSAEGYRPVTRENVVVRGGETVQVGTLEVDRGVRVRGRLRMPEGVTAKDRTLLFTEAGTSPDRARTVQSSLGDDGTFSATGFTPGTWRVTAHRQGWGEKPEPVLMAPLDQMLAVRDGELEVTFDAALLAAGQINVQLTDERLPPAPWVGGTATDAQAAFGQAASIVVKDERGQVVSEQRGLQQRNAGMVGWLQVPAGTYVVRYEAPGDEAREAKVSIKPGENVSVTITSKGMTAGAPRGPEVPSAVPMPVR